MVDRSKPKVVKPDFIVSAEARRELGRKMLVENASYFIEALNRLSQAIRLHNALWEINIDTGEQLDPDASQMFLLIHSEISEAFEGWRKDLKDSHLARPNMEVELADGLVRILHMGVRFGLDVPGATVEKCLYNVTRPDHQYEARIAKHGKKI